MSRILLNTTTKSGSVTRFSSQRKIIKTSLGTLVAFCYLGDTSSYRIQYSKSLDDGVTWSSFVDVAFGYDMVLTGGFDVQIDSSNNIWIFMNSGSDGYIKKLTYSAGTWTNGTTVSIMSNSNKGSILVKSNGDIWVSCFDDTNSDFYYNYSTDGGSIWIGMGTIVTSAAPKSGKLIEVGGNPWIIYEAGNSLIYRIYSGGSWGVEQTISSSGIVDGTNVLGVAMISDSSVWVFCTTTSGIKAYKYDGSTWDSGTLISDNTGDTSPSPCIFSNTNLAVFYKKSTGSIYCNRYNGTWSGSVLQGHGETNDDAPVALENHTEPFFIYTQGTSTPWNIYFDRIFIAESEYTTGLQYSAQRKLLKTTLGKLVLFYCATSTAATTIKYMTSDDDGLTWSSPISTGFGHVLGNGTFDANIDASNNIYIAGSGTSNTYVQKLTYSAGTWTNGTSIVAISHACTVGTVFMTSGGVLWYIGSQPSADIIWNTSSDDGATWGTHSHITNTSTIHDLKSFEMLNGDIWCIYTRTTAGVFYQVYSGGSWGTETSTSISTNTGSWLGVNRISDTDIWVAYGAVGTGNGINIIHYTGTWSAATQLSTNQNDGQPAIGNINGKPVVSFNSFVSNRNISYRLFNGSTWDAAVQLTNGSTSQVDYGPTLFESNSHVLYVAWMSWNTASNVGGVQFYRKFLIVYSSFLLKAKVVTSTLGDYLFKANLFKNISSNFTLKSSIFTYSYKLTATILSTISDSFLLKATLLKHNLSSYLLKSSVIILLRRLYNHCIISDVYGALSISTQVGGTRVITSPNILSKVYIYIKDPGSSGYTRVDILKNGVSIFTNPSDKPTVQYSDTNHFAEKTVNVILTAGDVISSNIDAAAIDSEDLSIILHLDSFTGLKPKVVNIDFFDRTFKLNINDIWVSNEINAKIRFENMMDITVTPTITLFLINGTSMSLTGSWSSEVIENDTYVLDNFVLTESDVGNAQLIIETAKDKYGVIMTKLQVPANISSFIGKITYNKYSIDNNVDLTFNVVSETISYSLDNTTFTNQVAWSKLLTVDITNALIGGNSSDGTKIVYVKFYSGVSECVKTAIIKYYVTPIGAWTCNIVKRVLEESNSEYTAFIALPDDAKIIPVVKARVYQDNALVQEDTIIHSYIFNGFDLTLGVNPITRDFSISSGEVLLGDDDGTYMNKSGTTLVLDANVSESRYDIVALDDLGNYVIIKGPEGEVNINPPYLNDLLFPKSSVAGESRLWPEFPLISDFYTPLYGLLVEQERGIGLTSYLNPLYCIDLRPSFIVVLFKLISEDSTVIKVEIEDAVGRTSSISTTIQKVSSLGYSSRTLKAYEDINKTIPVVSGTPTTATKLYFELI